MPDASVAVPPTALKMALSGLKLLQIELVQLASEVSVASAGTVVSCEIRSACRRGDAGRNGGEEEGLAKERPVKQFVSWLQKLLRNCFRARRTGERRN